MKTKMMMVLVMLAGVAMAAEYRPNPEVQNVETNIVYGEHKRCRLDVMWPKGKAHSLPVVVWFHGGGLEKGDKFFMTFSDQRIVQVAVRYPFIKGEGALSPEATLFECARAVAWVKENIAKYGADPKKMFLSGHSAGGYITMMLAMDPKYLVKFGMSPAELAGAVPLSGQATKHFNVRTVLGDKTPQYRPVIDELAPLAHVAEKTIPPMLLVVGDASANEWKCRAEENELLAASIRACNPEAKVEYVSLPATNHGSMRFAGYMYVQEFIQRSVRAKAQAAGKGKK